MLLVSGCFLFSGCAGLGGHHFAREAKRPDVRAAAEPMRLVSYLAIGREHLHGNRIGLAIEAFNGGLAAGENPGANYNGLGVAYARLGRGDLASRFFAKAMAFDPSNLAYANNLISLQNSPDMASQRTAQVVQAERQPEAKRDRVTLVRGGNRQFNLSTVEASSSPQQDAHLATTGRCAAAMPLGCGTIALPRIGSRSHPTSSFAARPVRTGARAPANASLPSPLDGVSAPAGKRKIIDLVAIKPPRRPSKASISPPEG
jgi:hypothetical protein